jgi:hypothetical protein
MDNTEIIIILSALSVIAGVCTSICKYCSKSRCTEISICNHCIDIKKDDLEHQKRDSMESEDMPQIDLKTIKTII